MGNKVKVRAIRKLEEEREGNMVEDIILALGYQSLNTHSFTIIIPASAQRSYHISFSSIPLPSAASRGIWKRKSFLTAGTTWLEDRIREGKWRDLDSVAEVMWRGLRRRNPQGIG